jgi:hypothetical protein
MLYNPPKNSFGRIGVEVSLWTLLNSHYEIVVFSNTFVGFSDIFYEFIITIYC